MGGGPQVRSRMLAHSKLYIKAYLLSTSTFTPLKSTWDCNYWGISCTDPIILSSDPNDTTQQMTITSGQPLITFGAPVFSASNLSHRYDSGDILIYAKATVASKVPNVILQTLL
jgi:hypothetical protein